MKWKFIFTLLILCFIQSSSVLHPLKMSVADIVYNEKKIHLRFKFFTDDFQSILGRFCKTPLDILNKGVDVNTAKCIQKYINANFAMYANKNLVKWDYKKSYLKEENEEVLYVEYEGQLSEINKVKSVKIKNTLLFEGIPEQKNLVNINLFDEVKVLTFNNDPKDYIKEVMY